MRQFVAERELENGILTVEGKKFRYLNSVLRVQPGDMIHVRLLDSTLQPMTVAKIDEDSKKIILQVAGDQVPKGEDLHASPIQDMPQAKLWLFQFVAKPPKMDLIIRQAVECGVQCIVPVEGTFCQKGNIESARKKASPGDDRWNRIITEAREQSGSPVSTRILEPVTVEQACKMMEKEGIPLSVVLYEQSEGTVSMAAALEGKKDSTQAAIFVGAEGGISPEEISTLKNAGVRSVHIKTNILRCETAALYGTAALQTLLYE